MARALTVAYVRVPPAQQAAWLAALADLERLERAAGRHVWVFRHPEEHDLFLEFSEGARASHRALEAAPGAALMEARLRELASYDAAPPVVWDEVPLTAVAVKGP